MKYITEVLIERPLKETTELFDDPNNLAKWQPGLKSVELLEGKQGREGAKTKMVYESKRGDLVMTEEITHRNLPDEFHAIYRASGVRNEMYNYFTAEGKQATRWKTISVFRFRGMMAMMSLFMRNAFRKQTLLNMEAFKAFAEQAEKTGS